MAIKYTRVIETKKQRQICTEVKLLFLTVKLLNVKKYRSKNALEQMKKVMIY